MTCKCKGADGCNTIQCLFVCSFDVKYPVDVNRLFDISRLVLTST